MKQEITRYIMFYVPAPRTDKDDEEVNEGEARTRGEKKCSNCSVKALNGVFHIVSQCKNLGDDMAVYCRVKKVAPALDKFTSGVVSLPSLPRAHLPLPGGPPHQLRF